MKQKITVETTVHAPLETVWDVFTDPVHIVKWSAASDDWHTPEAHNDLSVGGAFRSRMEAKDGSAGFDFEGVYDEVVPKERLAYTMSDGRKVVIVFTETDAGVEIVQSFDPETENPLEMQQAGWQEILNNFTRYTEGL